MNEVKQDVMYAIYDEDSNRWVEQDGIIGLPYDDCVNQFVEMLNVGHLYPTLIDKLRFLSENHFDVRPVN